MKQITLLTLIIASLLIQATAQDANSIWSIQKGDSIVFKTYLPPGYDPAWSKLKPKERLEAMKKQDEDIKAGRGNLRNGRISIVFNDRQATPTGFTSAATLSITSPYVYVLPMVYESINDTFYAHPANQFTETPGVGVTYTGASIYPLKMKVGDLLPDYKNVTIGYKASGSNKFMLPYITKTITTNYVNLDGQTLYSTIQNVWSAKEVTNNFSSITTTETTYANREVTGDTSITYKGKTYKGYIINFSVLTSLATAITSDYFEKSMQRMINRAQAKAAKQLAADETGTLTYLYREIYVPEIGVVGSTIVKKDGAFFSKTELAE